MDVAMRDASAVDVHGRGTARTAGTAWRGHNHPRRWERDTVRCLRAENAHLRALVARLTTDVERVARAMAWSRSALVAAGALPPEPWVGTVPF